MLLVQGDVFLAKVNNIPESATKVRKRHKGYVLAEGEATGHAHVIEEDIELYEEKGILYIKTDITVNLKHEEHKPITISKGIWKVDRIREYDPFKEEVRHIRD
ncbi:MAG: hypothetical protein HQK93_07550 [Nitrospirae bacterium]|nr:hypothetical protein [Nitrospirota bacterium]